MTLVTFVSDLHVGAGTAKEHVPELVEDIRDDDPHSVFVLGDVIHETGDHEQEVANLEFVVDSFRDLTQPTYFLGGNHDANVFDKRTFERKTGTKLDCVADLGDEYVTMVDSAFDRPLPNTSILGDDAIDILEQTMQYDPKPIVLSHFPITYTDEYQRSDFFGEYPEGVFPIDKKRIEMLDNQPNVVICGHMHFEESVAWGHDGIWTGAMTPYTQFEAVDEPVHSGSYATLDTDAIRELYGDPDA